MHIDDRWERIFSFVVCILASSMFYLLLQYRSVWSIDSFPMKNHTFYIGILPAIIQTNQLYEGIISKGREEQSAVSVDKALRPLNNDNWSTTVEEMRQNATILRFSYYNVSYEYTTYAMNMTLNYKTVPATTREIYHRKLLSVFPSLITWQNFLWKKKAASRNPEFLSAPYGWYYLDDFCLNNKTGEIHLYVEDYQHYLLLNASLPKVVIPHDSPNFRSHLHIIPHYSKMPKNHTVYNNLYIVINRGWNNMYHHSEWAIQFVRYMLFTAQYPPMNTVVPFPDIDWIKHSTHDAKGHYRYFRGYFDLILEGFKADINGVDRTPYILEGEAYQALNGTVCSKQGIIVPIITDMVKCFMDKKEAYHIRLLAYKRYKAPLPLSRPRKLLMKFMDRKTKNRGIKNQDAVIELLRNFTDVFFVVQSNQALSFSEQVVMMFSVDILVSVHGAQLTNVIFMLPYSALIEIFPPMFAPPYYRSVARSSDLIYHSIKKTKIVNKREYAFIRTNLDLTNKVFLVPLVTLYEIVNTTILEVWKRKYEMLPLM